MATYYCDASRPDDTGAGTSEATAKKTIAAGVALLSASGGDVLNLKAGTDYVLTSAVSLTTLAGSISAQTLIRGYTTTPGDGGLAVVTSATSGVNLFESGGGAYVRVESLNLTHTGSSRGAAFMAVSPGGTALLTIAGCLVDGCSHAVDGASRTFSSLSVVATTVRNCTAGGVTNFGSVDVLDDCFFFNNAGPCYDGAGSSCTLFAEGCVFAGHGATNSKGIYDSGASRSTTLTVLGCTFSGMAGDGIRSDETGGSCVVHLVNNIFYGNSGYGVNLPSGHALARANRNNAYSTNSSGSRNNLAAGTGDLDGSSTPAFTADPFTDSAGGDFSLNTTAGGGASLRAAGFPGIYPGNTTSGHRDVGAVQHADPAGGGGGASGLALSRLVGGL